MKPCILRARWPAMRGPLLPGNYLKAPKSQTVYEITAALAHRRIEERRGYNYALSCIRHAPSDVSAGSTVHNWYWDRRS